MKREGLGRALILVALAAGESVDRAIERAEMVVGRRSSLRVRGVLGSARRAAAPQASQVEVALAVQRTSSRWMARVGLLYAMAATLGMTLAALALVVPSSTEIGIVGW